MRISETAINAAVTPVFFGFYCFVMFLPVDCVLTLDFLEEKEERRVGIAYSGII